MEKMTITIQDWERKCDYNVSEYDMLERIWNSNIFSHKFTDEDILRG